MCLTRNLGWGGRLVRFVGILLAWALPLVIPPLWLRPWQPGFHVSFPGATWLSAAVKPLCRGQPAVAMRGSWAEPHFPRQWNVIAAETVRETHDPAAPAAAEAFVWAGVGSMRAHSSHTQ
ncbi:hypothetical protein N658DRAFT_496108 [Parathielavia hyrcaniae]|uniref:Uncharacterized protein n=1 Tax=Parathielavia hyrcaniae TaxID=113614 RepID=A0AAN6Q162_9PEZI|nr:hypothetical protein N658DRAFT_496108 [Parathielavia hyrcaniae]